MNDLIKKCPVCDKDMNWVKPGISQKTGKPYDGFWSCPDRCKKPNKQDETNKIIMDALVGISSQIEAINKRFDGLAKYLQDNLK